jgi:dolichol-phosphate mannosyltransferase
MLTVVIPFYNEMGCLDPLLRRLHEALGPCGLEYEILIVDNGSSPEQHRQLVARCAEPRLRVVVLSRNFGYQGALWAGLDHARGDPVVFMDADGEDPPELIPAFLERWRDGYEVVYGVRVSRHVGWFLGVCYKVFYRLLARWSSIHIPLDAGEFSLVGGQALTSLRSFTDRTRMMRILRAWIGFRQVGVPYDRPARIGGKSKFSILGSFAFAWDGFVAATDLPVRLSIASALFCFAAGMLGSVYYLFWHFYGRVKIPGFASLNITILFLFSMLFVCVAVLSRYVITLLDEARRRPPYLVSHEAGGPPAGPERERAGPRD